MKTFVLLALLFSGTCRADILTGTWFYYKKIYNGHDIPEPPDATLRLYFAFDGQGHDHLYWSHTDDGETCSRKGNYKYDGKILQDEIVWVDPKNAGNCSQDPDMQLGHATEAPLVMVNGDLQLTVDLGDDSLIYVWKKIGPFGDSN